MDNVEAPRPLSLDDLETIALAVGALPPGAQMTPELLDYTCTIIGHCASIGDHYKAGEGTAGDEIRARFGLL